MRYYLLLLLTIVFSVSAAGQSTITKYCGVETDASYREDIQKILSPLNEDIDLGLTSVPVALTFLMRSDSSSAYYEGLEQEIMDSLSAHFIPSGIHLYLAGSPVFIYEDLVYDYVTGEYEQLIYPGLKSNRVNVVLAGSVSQGGGGGVCGLARVFPNTVFINYGCIPSNTISHEIGHELQLVHTHDTKWGVELVNGSNCSIAGDLICDTPADPNRSDLVDSDCTWRGTYEDENGYDVDLVDANGDVYQTDVGNLMSYYGAFGCRNHFSYQQSLVMLGRVFLKLGTYGYETPKMDFEIYERTDMCDLGYAVSTRIKNPAPDVTYQWDFDGDGIIDRSGIDVRHFYSDYGNYTIKLTISYPDGRQFYRSELGAVKYLNESIAAPFLDDFEEDMERNYVTLVEQSLFIWRLGLHLPGGRIVALDQIHINENSMMEYKVDISDIEQPVLRFEYDCNTDAAVGGDTLLIELISCDEEPFVLFEKWGKYLGTDGEYQVLNLPLPEMDSEVVKIRFTTKGDAQDWHDIAIDNLEVYEGDLSYVKHFEDEEIVLFPNPARSTVMIQTELNISQIYLTDMYGKTVANYPGNTTIDLSDIPAGIYFVKILSEGKWVLRKIVKSD